MIKNIYPLGDYNTQQIREMAEAMQDPELDKDERTDPNELLALRPDAAKDPAAFIRAIPPEVAPFIVPDAFAGSAGPAMAARLTIPQLEHIGAGGDPFLIEAVRANLEIARGKSPDNQDIKDLLEYINRSPAWQL